MRGVDVIQRIARAAEAFGKAAGVGGMETAGSIVSFLASHPERALAFLDGQESPIDWPPNWHELGALTWHAANGRVVSPEYARRARQIRDMAKPLPQGERKADRGEG